MPLGDTSHVDANTRRQRHDLQSSVDRVGGGLAMQVCTRAMQGPGDVAYYGGGLSGLSRFLVWALGDPAVRAPIADRL